MNITLPFFRNIDSIITRKGICAGITFYQFFKVINIKKYIMFLRHNYSDKVIDSFLRFKNELFKNGKVNLIIGSNKKNLYKNIEKYIESNIENYMKINTFNNYLFQFSTNTFDISIDELDTLVEFKLIHKTPDFYVCDVIGNTSIIQNIYDSYFEFIKRMINTFGFAVTVNKTIYLNKDFKYERSDHIYITYTTKEKQLIYDSNVSEVNSTDMIFPFKIDFNGTIVLLKNINEKFVKDLQ